MHIQSCQPCFASNFGGYNPYSAISRRSYFPHVIAMALSWVLLLWQRQGWGPQFWKSTQVMSKGFCTWKWSPKLSIFRDSISMPFRLDCFSLFFGFRGAFGTSHPLLFAFPVVLVAPLCFHLIVFLLILEYQHSVVCGSHGWLGRIYSLFCRLCFFISLEHNHWEQAKSLLLLEVEVLCTWVLAWGLD